MITEWYPHELLLDLVDKTSHEREDDMDLYNE